MLEGDPVQDRDRGKSRVGDGDLGERAAVDERWRAIGEQHIGGPTGGCAKGDGLFSPGPTQRFGLATIHGVRPNKVMEAFQEWLIGGPQFPRRSSFGHRGSFGRVIQDVQLENEAAPGGPGGQ